MKAWHYYYKRNRGMQHHKNNPSSYVVYLQSLLSKNSIPFVDEAQFQAEQPVPEKTAGPLLTNLVEPLTGDLLARYSRQMLLKEIKYEGQLEISKMKIAIVGAGGIGCPTALYLAGAGVGTIGLFDSDVVDVTNLHRQIGHSTATLGIPKTTSLKKTLLNLNPHIKVNEHPFITVQTLQQLDEYTLVIDGSDNPQCRYIVNDYLMSKGRKLLSGACIGWEAQVTCYGGGSSPCYRCIWGDDQVSMGGCSTLGVIGMLPGIVGMILGVEALKIILQGSSSLQGFLLTYDGRSCAFRKMKIRGKKPECSACGSHKLDINSYPYERYGTCKPNTQPLPEVPTITWRQLVDQSLTQSLLLDVRSRAQYDIVHLAKSINIPYEELIKKSDTEIKEQFGNGGNLNVMCRIGVMSRRAADYLLANGVKQVASLAGGINGYAKQFDARIPDI